MAIDGCMASDGPADCPEQAGGRTQKTQRRKALFRELLLFRGSALFGEVGRLGKRMGKGRPSPMKQKMRLALTLKAPAAIKNIATTKAPPIHPTASATAKQGGQSGHATLSPLLQVVISSTEWAQAALQSFDAVVQPPRGFAALPSIADGRTVRSRSPSDELRVSIHARHH